MAFNEVKAAQAASAILSTLECPMDVLKLMKLLYLCERESLNRYAFSITGDRMVSMPHGPVLSQTLELINGAHAPVAGGWEELISDRAGHKIALRRNVDRDELDELSDAELSVIEDVCAQFGAMDKWAIRDYTHHNCPEWEDPCGSSSPISYRSIFLALGRDETAAKDLAENLKADDRLDRAFASH